MNTLNRYADIAGMIRKHGFFGLLVKFIEAGKDTVDKDYTKNWQNYLISGDEWKIQRNTAFERMPLISLVVPAFETPKHFLTELIDSLRSQTYENWELCIADVSRSKQVAGIVKEYQQTDARIKYRHLEENGGISANTNEGIEMAFGEYIGLLDHDDVLASNALYEVVRMLNAHPDTEVIYSDEDKIDALGQNHARPHFKLDYNQELLLHYNYICHFLVVKKSLLTQTGGLNPDFDGSQDYDLLLRLIEKTQAVRHVKKILYHWRVHENSTAGSSLTKDYAYHAGKRALEAYIRRNEIHALVRETKGRAYYDLVYELPQETVTEIDYKDINTESELDHRIRVCESEYILIYNSGQVKMPNVREKEELLRQCAQRQIGLTGVRFKKHGRIVSCGIGCDRSGNCAYQFSGMRTFFKGYFQRAVIPQDIGAVPLELCMFRKSAYEKAGPIDMSKKPLAAAVDFAGRIRQAGYEVVLDTKVTLKYKG